MKTFWTWIKKKLAVQASFWDCVPRRVVFFRDGEEIYFTVVAKRKAGLILEQAEKANLAQITRHPVLRRCLAFPRVLWTRIGAVLPLPQAVVQEWKNPARTRAHARQAFPLEMHSRLPFSVDDVVLDLHAGKSEEEEQVWHVVSVFRDHARAEIDFWLQKGIALDFLEWEGNLQAQLIQKLGSESAQPRFWFFDAEEATHLVACRGEELVCQKVLRDPSPEERRKRIRLLTKDAQFFEPDLGALPLTLPAAWPLRQHYLFAASAWRDFSRGWQGMNFMTKPEKFRASHEIFFRKIPVLARMLLGALVLTQILMGIEKGRLRKNIAELRQKTDAAVQIIAQKTGVSAEDVRRTRGAGLARGSASLLGTLAEVSDQLSRAAGADYRGRSLELSPERLLLDGEAGSFAAVEQIEERLSQSAALQQVELLTSYQKEGRVFFKLSAQKAKSHVE